MDCNGSLRNLAKDTSVLHRKQGRTTSSCSNGKGVCRLWMFSRNRDTHRLEQHNKIWGEKTILSNATSKIIVSHLQIIKHYINKLQYSDLNMGLWHPQIYFCGTWLVKKGVILLVLFEFLLRNVTGSMPCKTYFYCTFPC